MLPGPVCRVPGVGQSTICPVPGLRLTQPVHGAALVQATTQTRVPLVDCTYAQARQPGRVRGRQTQGKQAQLVAKFSPQEFAALMTVFNYLKISKSYPIY